MTGHSRLPPSSAARRVACPGSSALEFQFPQNPDSPHAREGEAAHWAAAEMLRFQNDTSFQFPTVAANGEYITQDMLEGAELYYDSIASVLYKAFGFMDYPQLHIEERLDISSIHPDCWGTPDCWVAVGNEIHLWDYKFGHRPVEVFENWQLIEYAAGIVQYLHINGFDDQFWHINFYIVQPRAHHKDGTVRHWRVKLSSLRAHFNTLIDAELVASQPNAMTFVSPECNYCSARHACSALQQSALTAIDVSVINTPEVLTERQTGWELHYLKRAAELLDARITGLEEQVIAMLKLGKYIPRFALEQSRGRQKWKRPDEIAILGEMFGINLSKPVDVLTPKQAVKAGIPQEIVDSYTEETKGALKLVGVEEQHARKIFGNT